MTHAEIAKELGVSRQYIQKVETMALRKLRNNICVMEYLASVDRESYFETLWEKIESMAEK
jgi:transcriptional regulator with XRE-family HTH domain